MKSLKHSVEYNDKYRGGILKFGCEISYNFETLNSQDSLKTLKSQEPTILNNGSILFHSKNRCCFKLRDFRNIFTQIY